MSAATIIFFDLVGFSKKSTPTQRELIDGFNDQLARVLRTLLAPPSGSPQAVVLPTGDGAAVALLHNEGRTWALEKEGFRLLGDLSAWSTEADCRLRIGVHTGAVEYVTDLNGRLNICGDTINKAQRVMDAADPNQVLVSDAAFDEHFGQDRNDLCDGPYEVVAKHDLQLTVYGLRGAAGNVWESGEPSASKRMEVRLTELPKSVEGSFSYRLARASRVALVQLTGKGLIKLLDSDPGALSEDLVTLRVYMPHPDALRDARTPLPGRDEQAGYVAAWQDLLGRLRDERKLTDVKLGLFSEPPYFGASFLDWDRPRGQIHVSPFLWGVDPKECPGFDLQWRGKNPPEVYAAYQKALGNIDALSTNGMPVG